MLHGGKVFVVGLCAICVADVSLSPLPRSLPLFFATVTSFSGFTWSLSRSLSLCLYFSFSRHRNPSLSLYLVALFLSLSPPLSLSFSARGRPTADDHGCGAALSVEGNPCPPTHQKRVHSVCLHLIFARLCTPVFRCARKATGTGHGRIQVLKKSSGHVAGVASRTTPKPQKRVHSIYLHLFLFDFFTLGLR